MVNGWGIYDRRARIPCMGFAALRARYRGWLEAKEVLTPTQANALREAMGLRFCGHNPFMAQVIKLERQIYRRTGVGPCPHPADEGRWILE